MFLICVCSNSTIVFTVSQFYNHVYKFQFISIFHCPNIAFQVLSRAFRNRFIELHYNDIPPEELVTILQEKSCIPLSYSKKMVAVMKELQVCWYLSLESRF